ncbi:MAG TPA: alpha/beta fold hydrolase [Prolixibacteraceae bacterium]|nr:alpha/beta fold hydrolase [Prolixibacteraceae bacterium]
MGLFYRDIGLGFPVVILHGLYGSSDNWLPIGRMLAEKFRVIMVDLRNHGASPHYNTHSYADMVTDLAWLLHELEIEKAHLLGHSMGGKLAIAFAADYPEKIQSLCVADIAPKNYLKTPASAIQYDFHKRLLNTLYNVDISVLKNRGEIDRALADSIPETIVRQFILKNVYRENGLFKWKINVEVLRQSLDHIISGVDADDYDDRIPILNYPVLFIKGALSGYIGNDDIPIIKKMYPEAKIETIENASHLLHAEKPNEFQNIVMGFWVAIR